MLKVGDLVYLLVPCMGNTPRTVGYVYEEYTIGTSKGCSIIFPNGRYDGFSEGEQKAYLKKLREPAVLKYKFTNVGKLTTDYMKGEFKLSFKKAESLLNCRIDQEKSEELVSSLLKELNIPRQNANQS